METKAPIPLPLLQGRSLPALVQAYFEFCHLKQLYRQGWLRRGVPPERCESVAEHTFGVAVLALFLCDAYYPQLDQLKVLRTALLHDFGEIYVGDLTPVDEITTAEKHRQEQEAIDQVLAKLPNGAAYVALWQAYAGEETPEARFVRQVDRLELVLQATVYHQQGLLRDPAEFFASVRRVIVTPELLAILAALEALLPSE
ncbi:MAG: HD domain-containing protein [Chloroflexi bacterium]|nr:HD domain-containing protein [Chloroflexota bacterium]